MFPITSTSNILSLTFIVISSYVLLLNTKLALSSQYLTVNISSSFVILSLNLIISPSYISFPFLSFSPVYCPAVFFSTGVAVGLLALSTINP